MTGITARDVMDALGLLVLFVSAWFMAEALEILAAAVTK